MAAPLPLVVVGAALSAIPSTPLIQVNPHVILGVVLPPLLYAAALQMPFVDFRRNLRVITSLAVVLVALSAAAAGLVVHAALPAVPLALAFAVGAVVAPPDAVAAISLGKRLGLPRRVVTILEGEGLVNDATALVLDVAIALVVPFVAFLLAEEVHASGIVAVVAAGLTLGNRAPGRVPAARRRAEEANWATFSMVVENGVFLLKGYPLPPAVREVARQGSLRALDRGGPRGRGHLGRRAVRLPPLHPRARAPTRPTHGGTARLDGRTPQGCRAGGG